jgi:hypothetical protein
MAVVSNAMRLSRSNKRQRGTREVEHILEAPIEPLPPVQETIQPVLSLESCRALTRLSKRTLSELAERYSVEGCSDKVASAYNIGGRSAGDISSTTSASSSALSPKTDQASPNEQPEQLASETEPNQQNSSAWSREQEEALLKSYTDKKLASLLEGFGLHKKMDKPKMVKRLLLLRMPVEERKKLEEEFDLFNSQKEKASFGQKPALQTQYSSGFNFVDTFDRRFYELFTPVQNKNWKTTVLLGLACYSFLNMHSLNSKFSLDRHFSGEWEEPHHHHLMCQISSRK